MARINVEDSWWVSPRRKALIRILGEEERADGAALALWRAAQEEWKENKGLLSKRCFDLLPSASALLECDLAVLEGAWVYVRGASKQFEWMENKRKAGSVGGKKSAEKRRETQGTAQPSPKQTRSRTKQIEADSKQNQAELKQTQAEGKQIQPSSSSSFSRSISKEESKGSNLTILPIGNEIQTTDKQSSFPNSDVGKFIGVYVKAFQRRYGSKTRPDLNDKVLGQIKGFLKNMEVDRACGLIQVYLQMDGKGDWFKTKGHDFITFKENLNPIGIAFDTGVESGTQLNWGDIWEEGDGPNSISK